MSRPRGWELPVALLCALASALPWVGVPAAVFLLCFLPGMAIVRHRLRETSLPRRLILGGVLSLAVVPAAAIPLSLALGRPTRLLALLAACLATALASWRKTAVTPPASPTLNVRHLAALLALALALQAGMNFAMHPDGRTIRWRGLPDLVFFTGMYQQLTLHTPPMDPESGARLLVHNWIYHFHFALVQLATGLPVWGTMRLVSAWMALTLLGLVYLVASDVLERPRAGLIAGLFLMSSGEVYWLARCIARLSWVPAPLPWRDSPFGVTLLFAWYNLPPLAAGLAVWYWFARHRRTGHGAPLAASLCLAAVMAFWHPILYAVFMTGFCLWILTLARVARPRATWLLYLATPLPFFLLYKLPYYGLSMPPRVVHADPTLAGMLARTEETLLWGGGVLVLGATGFLVSRGAGPLVWIASVALAAKVALVSPNPHWTHDPAYLALSLGAGLGVVALWKRSRVAGATLCGAALLTGVVAFGMHLGLALGVHHTYSDAELAAAAWLRGRTVADDLVGIHPNSRSSYTVIALARRRVAHGWTTHELDFHHDARQRERQAAELFRTDDPERAAALAKEQAIRFVYVGPDERAGGRHAGMTDACFPRVFASDEIEIRRFVCGQGAIAGRRSGTGSGSRS